MYVPPGPVAQLKWSKKVKKFNKTPRTQKYLVYMLT